MELQCDSCNKIFDYSTEPSYIWTFHKDDVPSVVGTDSITRCGDCPLVPHSLSLIPGCVVCDSDVTTCAYTTNNTLDRCQNCFDLSFIMFMNNVHKPLCTQQCLKTYAKKVRDDEDLSVKSRCCWCGRIAQTMPKCSRCKYARYCNSTCQRAAWPTHKNNCK